MLATGEPVTSADFAADHRAAAAARGVMSQIGPAIIFPLGVPGNVRGVLTAGRRHDTAPFPPALADVVASFAAQAGIALELTASRAEAERLSLYEDRDRIARDLHDLVIQRLYATGMSLETTMPMITRPEVASRISNAARHARASQVDVTVDVDGDGMLSVQVRDNGIGPPLAAGAAGCATWRPARRSPAANSGSARPIRRRRRREPGWNGGCPAADHWRLSMRPGLCLPGRGQSAGGRGGGPGRSGCSAPALRESTS